MIFCKKEILIYFNILLINTLVAQTNLDSTQIDTTWWYGHYSNGIEYLKSNNFEAAEIEFRTILEKDENVAHAYFGLGRVYDKKEDGYETAEENLEMAIELNPELIEAHYILGLVYENESSGSSAKDCFETVIELNPHHIDGWIALARAEEKFRKPWDNPIGPESLETIADALKINPGDKKLYEQYKKYLFWYSYEELSIPTFYYLRQHNPSLVDYPLDFAHVLYNMENYEKAMKLLDSIEVGYANYFQFEINLLRSKILFNTEEIEKGIVYYWSAINAIQDSADVNLLFSDLCYIMNDNEFEEYQSTPITEMSQFYIRFWSSRDPNLATKINERIPEHYKRVKYAWKNYRRFIPGYYEKMIIYKMDNPFFRKLKLKFGDELSDPFVSKALPEKRDLDDRGLIYIRHGEPDNFAFYNCMSCPQNISWLYFASQSRTELIFHFSKHSDVIGWFLESMPYSFANRGDFGGLYAQFDPTINRNPEVDLRLYRYEELNKENIEKVEVGFKTETSDYVYEDNLIEFPLDYLCFKDENFNTRVDFFYGVDGENFTLDISKQKNFLSYVTFIGIFDLNWTEIVRLNYDQRIPVNVEEDKWEEMSIVETEGFSIRPGGYNFELQLQDKMSDNMGVYKGTITIPNYWTNELMLSDIVLSDTVSRKTEPTRFKRGDIAFSPHMFTAYGEEETVGIYFEIYNLVYDYGDRTNFEITWWLEEVGVDEADIEAVQSTLPYNGKSRDDNIYINLNLSDTDSGDYELVILVKDIVSKAEVSKKVRLTVL
jgi:GWxTD domain-containing protein